MNNDEHNPFNWDGNLWWLGVFMGILGGLAKMMQAYDHTRRLTLFCIIKDMLYSGIVGLGMFFAADAAGLPASGCAAVAGIAGHMGARLMFLVEMKIEDHIKRTNGDK